MFSGNLKRCGRERVKLKQLDTPPIHIELLFSNCQIVTGLIWVGNEPRLSTQYSLPLKYSLSIFIVTFLLYSGMCFDLATSGYINFPLFSISTGKSSEMKNFNNGCLFHTNSLCCGNANLTITAERGPLCTG